MYMDCTVVHVQHQYKIKCACFPIVAHKYLGLAMHGWHLATTSETYKIIMLSTCKLLGSLCREGGGGWEGEGEGVEEVEGEGVGEVEGGERGRRRGEEGEGREGGRGGGEGRGKHIIM